MHKTLKALIIALTIAFIILSEDTPYQVIGEILAIIMIVWFIVKNTSTYKKSCNLIMDDFYNLRENSIFACICGLIFFSYFLYDAYVIDKSKSYFTFLLVLYFVIDLSLPLLNLSKLFNRGFIKSDGTIIYFSDIDKITCCDTIVPIYKKINITYDGNKYIEFIIRKKSMKK